MTWDGEEYQARFDRLAASGADVHGEADLVQRRGPASVLDAGCGTGRVAIELARRGVEVVGVDVDESMLATARRRAPELRWVAADLTDAASLGAAATTSVACLPSATHLHAQIASNQFRRPTRTRPPS